MNRDFISRFSQMKENQPGSVSKEENDHVYAAPGNTRNICFAFPDGRLVSLNYAYLICCEYMPEQSMIQLEFTTHRVTLKGYNLEPLYFQLFDQAIRMLKCTDERYKAINSTESMVHHLHIQAVS